MGTLRRRSHLLSAAAFTFLVLFAAALGTGLVADAEQLKQEARPRSPEEQAVVGPARARRKLAGLGSSPPTCRARCGRCSPCRPVLVVIHPGRRILPQEYYPEAWRCKCGNKLFLP